MCVFFLFVPHSLSLSNNLKRFRWVVLYQSEKDKEEKKSHVKLLHQFPIFFWATIQFFVIVLFVSLAATQIDKVSIWYSVPLQSMSDKFFVVERIVFGHEYIIYYLNVSQNCKDHVNVLWDKIIASFAILECDVRTLVEQSDTCESRKSFSPRQKPCIWFSDQRIIHRINTEYFYLNIISGPYRFV